MKRDFQTWIRFFPPLLSLQMPPSLYENKYWRQGPLMSLRKNPFAKKIMSIGSFCFGRVM